jgi:hypothetical protein
VSLSWVKDVDQALSCCTACAGQGGTLSLLYDSVGPTGADRVVGPMSRSLHQYGFGAVQAVQGHGGHGVTGRVPQAPETQPHGAALAGRVPRGCGRAGRLTDVKSWARLCGARPGSGGG